MNDVYIEGAKVGGVGFDDGFDCTAPGTRPHRCKADGNWGPQGREFARFHIAGDQDVVIRQPVPGIRQVQVELMGRCLECDRPYTSDTLRVSKSMARAIASAIMGAAAEGP